MHDALCYTVCASVFIVCVVVVVVVERHRVRFRVRALEKLFAQRGWTPLICAAENGHADCVRLLIDAGANKNAKNRVRDRSVGS